MRRLISCTVAVVVLGFAGTVLAQQFKYKKPGHLESGDKGRETMKVWVPGMRYPIRQAPSYANSQVWGHGGSQGPGGSECDSANYSYPWWDNYCEPRRWDMPLCPGGKGHQGQDIRPKGCDDSKYWAVAAEKGTIIDDTGTAIKLKTASGRTHRYLHMNLSTVVVDVGDKLQPGDKIGKVSDYTGGQYGTTIHLHYDFKQYVKNDPKSGGSVKSTVFIPTYMSLVDSYMRLLGNGGLGDQYKAEMEVRILNGQDRYSAGSSKDVPDFFPGDTVEAAIYLKNTSQVNWPTQTWAGYWFEDPYLKPLDYQIDTDHPKHDQKTWMVNSADSAKENPDALAKSGTLLMHAFTTGETKRVQLKLEAGPYSIGAADHPDVRAWLQKMEGIYGTQTGFRKKPSNTNKFGKNIRDYAQLDILSRDHWHFAGDKESGVEGWTGDGDSKEVKRNTKDDLLTQNVGGGDGQLVSPKWTEIDADEWPELVVRLRSHDGSHETSIFWAGEGQSFSAERKVTFRASGDSNLNTYVVPIGDHPEWKGTVTKLRVDLLDGEAPGANDRGWYGLGDLFLQSFETQKTNSERESYVDEQPVELVNLTPQGGGDTGTIGDPPDAGGSRVDTGGGGGGGKQSGGSNRVSTSTGCGCSVGGAPVPVTSIVVFLCGLIVVRRRRYAETA